MIYETSLQKQRKKEITVAVSRAWGTTYHRLLDDILLHPRLDAAFVWGERILLGEVRGRHNKSTAYGTFTIDKQKIDFGVRKKAVLIVAWTDRIGWCYFHEHTGEFHTQNRRDRNDPYDRDIVGNYPLTVFRPIEDLPNG